MKLLSVLSIHVAARGRPGFKRRRSPARSAQPCQPWFSPGESDNGDAVDVTGGVDTPGPSANAKTLDAHGFDVADHMSDYSPSLPPSPPDEPASVGFSAAAAAAGVAGGPAADAEGEGHEERGLAGGSDSDFDGSMNILMGGPAHPAAESDSDSEKSAFATGLELGKTGKRHKRAKDPEEGRGHGPGASSSTKPSDRGPPTPAAPAPAAAADARQRQQRGPRGSASMFQEDTIWFGDTPLIKRNDTAVTLRC